MADFTLPLREEDIDPDPLRQFAAWYNDAARAGVRDPTAMAVATSTVDGVPSVRMVLLKGYDERGFVFYTNYNSRKGRELEANPRAALLFYWDPLGRQVRIEGHVQRTSPDESASYVHSRPRRSQLAGAGIAPKRSHRQPKRTRATSRQPVRIVWRRRTARPGYLGRFPPVPVQVRVLAEPGGQASRSLGLQR